MCVNAPDSRVAPDVFRLDTDWLKSGEGPVRMRSGRRRVRVWEVCEKLSQKS